VAFVSLARAFTRRAWDCGFHPRAGRLKAPATFTKPAGAGSIPIREATAVAFVSLARAFTRRAIMRQAQSIW
jgi:hypothetical protein